MNDNKHLDSYQYKIIAPDGTEKTLICEHSLFEGNEHQQIVQFEELAKGNQNQSHSLEINQALFQIAEQAHATNDFSKFFITLHKIIAKLTYAENFFIALYDEWQQNISFPYIVDIDSDPKSWSKKLSKLPVEELNNTLTGYMLRTGKVLHANAQLMEQLTERGEINQIGQDSSEWLGFPLKKGQQILGAMVVQSYDPEVRYKKKDIELLTFVSQHVASALSRMQADKALKQSEKKLREILENSMVISYKFNLAENRYEYISKSIKKVFGFIKDKYVAEDLENAKTRIHPDDQVRYREKFIELIQKINANNDYLVPNIEYRWRHYDGHYYWYSESRTVVCGKNKEPMAIIGNVRDITEIKKAEQNLQQAKEELLKIQELENIGVLAGGLAHDFNNILTGIFGNLSLIKMHLTESHPVYKYLTKTERSMDRATRLTKQLLTFAKGGDPVRENVDLATLIKETALFDLTGSNVKLTFDFSKKYLGVSIDRSQIQQLISNLVINANQAMPDGGKLLIRLEKVELVDNEVGILQQGSYIKTIVRDKGTGISKENQSRIFDPYFTTKKAGSGLGLATVYSIIKKHGGYITVQSELGKGTTFSLYLPAIELTEEEEAPLVEEEKSTVRSGKVLVMDDDEMILSLVTSILEIHNYSVTTAVDGEQAIQLYQQSLDQQQPYDAVIMDLTIPGGMGGKDAVQEVLKIDSNAKCIVSSGYADDPIIANFQQYGFKGVVSKPFAVKDLTELLDKII